MALGSASGCINHPSIEATARCKQCGKPLCSACRVPGTVGFYCGEDCKARHEQFIQRAAQLDGMRKKPGLSFQAIKRYVTTILVTAVIVVAVAVALTFVGIDLPFGLGGVAHWLRAILGF